MMETQKAFSGAHSCILGLLCPPATWSMVNNVHSVPLCAHHTEHIFSTDYDAVVDGTGCAGSSDTLACLRTVPYDTLKAAVDTAPFIFGYQVCNPCVIVQELTVV